MPYGTLCIKMKFLSWLWMPKWICLTAMRPFRVHEYIFGAVSSIKTQSDAQIVDSLCRGEVDTSQGMGLLLCYTILATIFHVKKIVLELVGFLKCNLRRFFKSRFIALLNRWMMKIKKIQMYRLDLVSFLTFLGVYFFYTLK